MRAFPKPQQCVAHWIHLFCPLPFILACLLPFTRIISIFPAIRKGFCCDWHIIPRRETFLRYFAPFAKHSSRTQCHPPLPMSAALVYLRSPSLRDRFSRYSVFRYITKNSPFLLCSPQYDPPCIRHLFHQIHTISLIQSTVRHFVS